jgi:penicillin-binding protein 2
MRFKIIRHVTIFLLLAVAANLFYIQVIRGYYYFALSMRNRIRVVALEGVRGRIMDREGQILADNQLTFNVSVVPQDIDERQALFAYLSRVIKVSPAELNRRFRIRFLTPFTPVVIAEDIPRDVAVEIEENKFRFPGLMVEEGYRRIYPQGSVGAHVLGYVGKISRAKIEQLKDYGYTMQSIVGYSGVEEFYDDDLRGESGGRQIEINNRGQEVRLLGLRNPTVGKDVTLTIDERVQDIAAEILLGKRGAVVIMDADNGEVLGLVSSPSFDPNHFVDANQRSNLNSYFNDAASPLLNRATSGQYPPGSVFKIPVAIAALEGNHITRNTTFICPGYYAIGQYRYGCTHVHNDENLIEAITHSCNVYFFHAGLLVGSDEIRRFARLLGLNARTNVDLPSESAGAIPSRNSYRGRWFTGDTINFSIGQGKVLTTPIQLVKMIAIIANRGKVVQPHFILAVGDGPSGHLLKPSMIKLRKETYRDVEEGLKNVVEDPTGTANTLAISGLKSFGKTGTAQAGAGRENHAWFVGYTKTDKRTVAYCIFLENGGSSHNAVLLARELLLRINAVGII